jgi:hypothetical protein
VTAARLVVSSAWIVVCVAWIVVCVGLTWNIAPALWDVLCEQDAGRAIASAAVPAGAAALPPRASSNGGDR